MDPQTEKEVARDDVSNSDSKDKQNGRGETPNVDNQRIDGQSYRAENLASCGLFQQEGLPDLVAQGDLEHLNRRELIDQCHLRDYQKSQSEEKELERSKQLNAWEERYGSEIQKRVEAEEECFKAEVKADKALKSVQQNLESLESTGGKGSDFSKSGQVSSDTPSETFTSNTDSGIMGSESLQPEDADLSMHIPQDDGTKAAGIKTHFFNKWPELSKNLEVKSE